MDQSLLVVNRVGAGEELLTALRQRGFLFDVAFWTQDVEVGTWHLVIASPEVDRKGTTDAYLRVLEQVRKLDSWKDIDRFEIRLVGVHDPIASAVSSYADGFVGASLHRIEGFYHDRVALAGQIYIYPKNN